VVRIDAGGEFRGTGFFVAPGEVITCAHVVHGRGEVVVEWSGRRLPATVAAAVPDLPADDPAARFYPLPDVALLRLAETLHHPCVGLDLAEPVTGPPPEILEEASFRAARAGVDATLPDDAGRMRPVAELLDELVELVRPSARALGCEGPLEGLFDLLAQGGGAGLQRDAAGDRGDTGAVVARLVACAMEDGVARSSSD